MERSKDILRLLNISQCISRNSPLEGKRWMMIELCPPTEFRTDLFSHLSNQSFSQYRRSGNFRVKYTSPFNFSRCFIFVARAHRRKLNHAKILFTHTRARSRSRARDRIPCRAIGEKLEPRISASEGMQQTPMPYH